MKLKLTLLKLLKTFTNHFTIEAHSDLMADVDVWERAQLGIFEPGHFHSYYEILVFKKGGGTHQMINGVYEVEDNSVHILPGNNFHELKRTTETDGFEIIFSEVYLNQLQKFDTKTNYVQYFSEPHVLNFTATQFSEFEGYFDELIKNKDNKPIFYNWVSIILLKLISDDSNESKNTTNSTFEKIVLDLLNSHYKEKQNLKFYASKLNMSINTFQRHAKSCFGKSIIGFQNEKIIQEIKFLLSQNKKTIKEISFEFNFTDVSHFSHFFKKHTGLSPGTFRKSTMV